MLHFYRNLIVLYKIITELQFDYHKMTFCLLKKEQILIFDFQIKAE